MAPNGLLISSGDRNHWKDFCTAWRLSQPESRRDDKLKIN